MNETDINTVVCPEEYDFVRPHKKGNTFVTGYCRQSPRSFLPYYFLLISSSTFAFALPTLVAVPSATL